MRDASWKPLKTTVTWVAAALCGCQTTAQVEQDVQASTSVTPAASKKTLPTLPLPVPSAAPQPMMGGWHHRSPYGQLYFQGRAVSVEGEVVNTSATIPFPNMTQGVQLTLKTREGEKTVHLGPYWYISQQKFTFASGERVRVEGHSVVIAGQTIIMASSIQKDNASLQLRDSSGFPFWAGGRSRRLP